MTTQFGPLSVGEDGAALFDERGKRLADLYLVPHFREPSDLVDLQGRRLALAQLFAAAPAMVEALGSLYEQVERHLDRCKGWLPDHACAECVPHSEILVEGFQCGRHAARAALKKAGR